ncbi:hypothetical protein LXD69_10220 [Flavobacterium sediminilitoris]|uniref:Uncharacterized protein n=1 Tax=Flavobacterium sediminilitoris TaxID=2024526 RepID=A0ABY4HHW7_9FLAO|nr:MULTISPECIES: hypothetical protein [Flavobacterium]UOX32427.1 hypothetical protein LXD69_10220 [Flavobacterium sediminilitoris]
MRININIPAKWNELNQKQFERIALLISTSDASLIRDIRLLKVLFNFKWYHFKKSANFYYFLSQVPYSEWKKYIAFILTDNNRTKFEPIIKVGKKLYYGPMDRIINLTADEFAVADDLHIRFRETKDIEFAQNLFHVLYQEQPQRKLFNKLDLPGQINKAVSNETLLATEIAYFGCKNHIANKFKKAFPKSKAGASSKNRTGFGKIIQQMAKGDLSKTPIIKQTNIYEFLFQFQDDIETMQKAKSKK